mmetsp:Transcript_6012/g.14566  ORF Transcript_6012/g.14566 Transcript_6012/m.14566 type:complete len:80 (-) Transcript_6012:77-316(-)
MDSSNLCIRGSSKSQIKPLFGQTKILPNLTVLLRKTNYIPGTNSIKRFAILSFVLEFKEKEIFLSMFLLYSRKSAVPLY